MIRLFEVPADLVLMAEPPSRFVRLCLIHLIPLPRSLVCPSTEHPTPQERFVGYGHAHPMPWWILWDTVTNAKVATVMDFVVTWEPGYEDIFNSLAPVAGRDVAGFSGRKRYRRQATPS